MNRTKCLGCGLVNVVTDTTCRRCGQSLVDQEQVEEVIVKRRSIRTRVVWVLTTTALVVFISYMSLLVTSDDLRYDHREIVDRAISIIESSGFQKEAFVLKRVVRYRSTDNWWNRYLGHRDAYAATNFPFEIVTLYPEFFGKTVDDNERAIILLHEAQHLFGSGEEKALEIVWRNKTRLGWIEQTYGNTKVWDNTQDLTKRFVPGLFTCGPDGKSDCTE